MKKNNFKKNDGIKKICAHLSGILVILITFTPLLHSKTVHAAYNFPTSLEVGTWYWNGLSDHNTASIKHLVSVLKREKITTLYLNIEDYLAIPATPLTVKTILLEKYNAKVDTLLAEASRQNISIHAMAGAANWGNQTYAYVPKKLLSFVLEYNKKNATGPKFAGMQFDIEFYNQPDFDLQKNTDSLEFLTLVNSLVTLTKTYYPSLSPSFGLGFAVPYWYDKTRSPVPQVLWNGRTKTVGDHTMDILNRYPKSNTVVMAYRDKATGSGGSIILIKEEIAYAENYAKNVKIVLGMETEVNEVSRISFFGQTKDDVKKAASEIYAAYKNSSAFGGIAIHHWDSYRIMPE